MNLLLTLLVAWTLVSNSRDDGLSKYEIEFQGDSTSFATVKASLPCSSGLKISTYGAWSQPNGWGTYIEDLEVVDDQGNSLSVEPTEKCTWKVSDSQSSRMNITYKVRLSHAKITDENWPEGPKTTGAYWDGSTLFMLTAPLFVFSDESQKFHIELIAPKNCKVLTAWKAGSKANRFFCDTIEEAIKNTVVLGKPDNSEVKTDHFSVTVAMLGEFRGKSDLIGPVVEKYLKYYEHLYREEGNFNYLVVMFPQSMETGEAYSNSYVHVSPQIPTSENRAIWSGIVAHEIGHFWLGRKIAAKDWATSQWFSEGATEYMSTLAEVRCGEISNKEFLDTIQRNVELYMLFKKGPPFDSVSLVGAGSNKSVNNVALYNGGWVSCFCLDVMIREQTNNQKSFDDFMRHLDREFGLKDIKYDLGDLIQTANVVSKSNTRDFFHRYVIGKETIPVETFLRKAGLKASIGAASAYIDIDTKSKGLPVEIRSSLFKGEASKIEQSIDELFKQWNRYDSPGVAVTITRNDRVLMQKNYGMANLEHQIPIHSQTVFHTASLSKQFTAYLILLLEQRGKLSLDDPVSKFLPQMTSPIGPITLRHLLHHTSGIGDQWQLLALSGVQPEDLVSQDQVLRLIAQQTELQFTPGEKQAYCNSGYSILAAIVEKVSEQTFREFANKEIFEPLGMTRTLFRDSIREVVPNRATSYNVVQQDKVELRELNYVTYGATSLLTCSDDMGKWMLHLLSLKKSGSPFINRMLERGKLSDGKAVNFGFGLFVDSYREKEMFGHPGADGGFRSSVFVFPELDFGVVVLGNASDINHWQLPKSIADLFIRNCKSNLYAMV